MPDQGVIRQARDDITYFARAVCGAPLWPHQAEVATNASRYRVILAGRRAGKSRLLAVLALHAAFRKPGTTVVIVSVGEVASLRVLADVAALTSSPLLAGSVVDELKATVRLSTGSVIESFPASMKQIRGIGADLLILDEAAFIPRDIWSAAYPSVADRVKGGAKVVIASTPWPLADSWFYTWHQRGTAGADPLVTSWHWPSDVNPGIGEAELADMRAGMSEEEYDREILAKWSSEQGTWFTPAEIEAAVAGYELMSPERARQLSPWDARRNERERRYSAVGGIDYGFAADANTVTVISALEDGGANARLIHYVSWMEGHHGMEYEPFVTRLVDISKSYDMRLWASETNGVGSAPTQDLRRRLREEGCGGWVIPVWTDARRKQAGFSKVKSLMQAGTLILPRDPALLRELHALDYERTEAGSMRIAARTGYHDDLSMSLLQAVSCLRPLPNPDTTSFGAAYEHAVTGRGTIMPLSPRPRLHHRLSFTIAEGRERSTASAW
jgi:Terminase large subunit, T4likevirus-type, N-terminal